jgi:hypothetical protein
MFAFIDGELDRRLPSPIPISDTVAIAILAVLELAAVWCVVRIWREPNRPVAACLFWTVVTVVPVLGLIAYAAWRDPSPPPRDPTDRRRESRMGDSE